jgi:hypothetical protein
MDAGDGYTAALAFAQASGKLWQARQLCVRIMIDQSD